MNQRKAAFAAVLFFVALSFVQTASALPSVDWHALQPSLGYFELTMKWRAISAELLKSGLTPTQVAQELDKYAATQKAPAFDKAKASFLKEVLFVQQKTSAELLAAPGTALRNTNSPRAESRRSPSRIYSTLASRGRRS